MLLIWRFVNHDANYYLLYIHLKIITNTLLLTRRHELGKNKSIHFSVLTWHVVQTWYRHILIKKYCDEHFLVRVIAIVFGEDENYYNHKIPFQDLAPTTDWMTDISFFGLGLRKYLIEKKGHNNLVTRLCPWQVRLK